VIFRHNQRLKRLDVDGTIAQVPWPMEHTLDRLGLSGDGKTLVSYSGHRLFLWDWEKKALRKSWSISDEKQRTCWFVFPSHNAHYVAVRGVQGRDTNFVEVWDSVTGKKTAGVAVPTVSSFGFDP